MWSHADWLQPGLGLEISGILAAEVSMNMSDSERITLTSRATLASSLDLTLSYTLLVILIQNCNYPSKSLNFGLIKLRFFLVRCLEIPTFFYIL